VESELEYRKRLAGDRTVSTGAAAAAPTPKLTFTTDKDANKKLARPASRGGKVASGGYGVPLPLLGAAALLAVGVLSSTPWDPTPPHPSSPRSAAAYMAGGRALERRPRARATTAAA
jgi:hypothetical protein